MATQSARPEPTYTATTRTARQRLHDSMHEFATAEHKSSGLVVEAALSVPVGCKQMDHTKLVFQARAANGEQVRGNRQQLLKKPAACKVEQTLLKKPAACKVEQTLLEKKPAACKVEPNVKTEEGGAEPERKYRVCAQSNNKSPVGAKYGQKSPVGATSGSKSPVVGKLGSKSQNAAKKRKAVGCATLAMAPSFETLPANKTARCFVAKFARLYRQVGEWMWLCLRTDLWWQPGDDLLSQTLKCRRSRAYKRAYKEKTEQLRAEGLEENDIRQGAVDDAGEAFRQEGRSCLKITDVDMY